MSPSWVQDGRPDEDDDDVLPTPQMVNSTRQFDRELQLLLREKLRLHPQLKLADLHQLTLYQELLLLQEFEGREEKLQEKLSLCIREENHITVGGRQDARWSSQQRKDL